MSTLLSFYRQLDEELFQKIRYTEQPLRASYTNENGEFIEMEVALEEGQENTFQLLDPKVHWDPELHNVDFHFEIEIENPRFLFGNNGLTDSKGELGVAIRWHSRDSSQMRIKPVGIIKSTDYNFYHKDKLSIEKGVIRGQITLEVLLYMYSPSPMQQVAAGTILGTLSSCNILIDGNSSMFPILEIDDPTKPLWWVECNFEDALYDSFTDDHVSIIINVGHRNAKHLKLDRGIGSSPLLLEILGSGIQTIIEEAKLQGDWEDIINNRSEPGSIGEAIYYFIESFSWDTSSPTKLLKSIREDFDKRF
mgnify:CR=1 FL=1